MSLSKVNTQFKNYGQYIFNDPATDFTTIKTDVFDGILNAEGKAGVTLKVPAFSFRLIQIDSYVRYKWGERNALCIDAGVSSRFEYPGPTD